MHLYCNLLSYLAALHLLITKRSGVVNVELKSKIHERSEQKKIMA